MKNEKINMENGDAKENTRDQDMTEGVGRERDTTGTDMGTRM